MKCGGINIDPQLHGAFLERSRVVNLSEHLFKGRSSQLCDEDSRTVTLLRVSRLVLPSRFCYELVEAVKALELEGCKRTVLARAVNYLHLPYQAVPMEGVDC